MKIEARDNRVAVATAINWTMCKSFAPRSRQKTMPAPHHLIFYRPNALQDTQPTVSKHSGTQGISIKGGWLNKMFFSI